MEAVGWVSLWGALQAQMGGTACAHTHTDFCVGGGLTAGTNKHFHT